MKLKHFDGIISEKTIKLEIKSRALLFGKNTRVRKIRILLFNQSGGVVGNHGEEREKKYQ